MFDLTMSLCEAFKAFTPLSVRRERACEVFRLFARYRKWARKNTKDGKRVIRRPAGDNWF